VKNNPQNAQKLSNGWFKYFGFRIPPQNIVCDGCMVDNPSLIDQACPVRPCVIEKNLANCSQCEQYVCEKLADRMVIYQEIRTEINAEIPEDDYVCFIQPYENKKRLDAIRASRD
jgi:hypothetical protein